MIKLAIISPNKDSYSETFIQAHIDLLAGEKYLLYGSYSPIYFSGQQLVLSINPVKRIILKYLFKKSLIDYSISKFLRKNKIDVILAEYGPTGSAMLNIAKNLKIPMIVHFHGYDATSELVIKEYRDLYKEMFLYSSFIISVSHKMHEKLAALGANEKKLVYNPYGPAKYFESITPDYKNSEYALFVGRFVNKKAPYLLIEIMRLISKKGVDIKLIMAGDGVLLESCKKMAMIVGLEDKIIFPGAVNHEEVKTLMEKSFCYIQHSVTTSDGETEGTPVSIIEASQAGLPVISTIHAGIPDVVIHDETGFLVNEYDIDAMVDYLLLLNLNRELAETMGKRGKNRIKENFSMDRHITVLNNLISKSVRIG